MDYTNLNISNLKNIAYDNIDLLDDVLIKKDFMLNSIYVFIVMKKYNIKGLENELLSIL